MNLFNRWNKNIAGLISAKGEALTTGQSRLRIIRLFCLFLFALVIIRMGDLTLLQIPGEPDNDYRVSNAEGTFERADIVDRNGVLLATTLQVASVYADPKLIDNKPFIANQLEDILKVENLKDKLNKDTRFVWIKRGITPDQHYQINALGSPGLGFRTETRRFYPQGRNASHLIGYTSVDGKGLAGLELFYNSRLKKGGAPLQANMDVRIQYALVQSLRESMEEFKAKAAIGGVIDIESGEVIAAVSLPDFDPHHAGKATDNERFNRFALGVYEMGSTFKLFSTANYLEETGHEFHQSFDVREPLKVGRFTINDFHAEKRVLTLPEVFIHSSNIGSALMGRAIGADSMKRFYRDLGFMDSIHADFPSLAKPLTPSPWRDVNTLTAAYGHGIAVTPLHVLQAAGTVANGGIVPRLSFAKKDMKDIRVESRILSASTAYKMKQLLRLNVTNGSGARSEVAGYGVGGKTGTSEKSVAGGYDRNKLLSSYIGVFPVHAPKYAVLAVLDEPKGNKASFGFATGGWTAAPVVGKVIADIARIEGMAPELNAPNLTAGLDKYIKQEAGGYSPASYTQ
jgi:cell division protein FtsI (penicillin-binding protein 3)